MLIYVSFSKESLDLATSILLLEAPSPVSAYNIFIEQAQLVEWNLKANSFLTPPPTASQCFKWVDGPGGKKETLSPLEHTL